MSGAAPEPAGPGTRPERVGSGDGRRSRSLVIIPAYNEEATIGPTLERLTQIVSDVDIVVVDDGSIDGTAEVARRCGAVVIRLPFNLGIGGALRTGFRYAVAHGYQRAVQFDADGQHDATSVSVLLDALGEDVDLVIGNRFGPDATAGATPYDIGRVRSRAMGMLRVLIRQLSGQHVTDTSSGFRAFSEPMLEYFAGEYPLEYLESVEALLLASTRGFRVAEVPVVMHERAGGKASQHRMKLLYHFCRLLLVLAATAPKRRRAAPVAAAEASAVGEGR